MVAWLLRTIFELLRDRSSAKYVLKRNEIYKVIPKKCPICGDTCNGKLKVVLSEKGTYCVCHRDKTHKWKIEYNDVIECDKISDNIYVYIHRMLNFYKGMTDKLIPL